MRRREKRCEVMVRAGTYRAPGQCEKRLSLKRVVMGGTTVLLCPHHVAMLGRGTAPQMAP